MNPPMNDEARRAIEAMREQISQALQKRLAGYVNTPATPEAVARMSAQVKAIEEEFFGRTLPDVTAECGPDPEGDPNKLDVQITFGPRSVQLLREQGKLIDECDNGQ